MNQMLGIALIAGALTIPYWGYQKATNQPKARSAQRRLRLFTGAFGTFCALEIAFAGFVAANSNNPNAGKIAGRHVALPAVVLISGLASKKGWMREPFKKFEEPTEPVAANLKSIQSGSLMPLMQVGRLKAIQDPQGKSRAV